MKLKPTYRNIQTILCSYCTKGLSKDGEKCSNCLGLGEYYVARNEHRVFVKVNKGIHGSHS